MLGFSRGKGVIGLVLKKSLCKAARGQLSTSGRRLDTVHNLGPDNLLRNFFRKEKTLLNLRVSRTKKILPGVRRNRLLEYTSYSTGSQGPFIIPAGIIRVSRKKSRGLEKALTQQRTVPFIRKRKRLKSPGNGSWKERKSTRRNTIWRKLKRYDRRLGGETGVIRQQQKREKMISRRLSTVARRKKNRYEEFK